MKVKPKNKIYSNKMIVIGLSIMFIFFIVAILSNLHIIAGNWTEKIGNSYENPNLVNFLGTDIFGRSVLQKIIKGIEVAINVGVIVSIISIMIGVTLGVISGYFGGYVDEIIKWIYTIIASVPNIMLLIAITFVLGKGLKTVCIALGITRWVEICRLVRAETIKHKNLQYVLAAKAIGAGHFRRIFHHILPNISHIIFIQASIIFQAAIKSEVMLSFLGLGVQNGTSWGIIIGNAKVELLRGEWWQITFATLTMFLLILASNIFTESLKNILNNKPKQN